MPEPDLVIGDAGQELGNVGIADRRVRVDHGINAVAASQLVGVVAGAASQGVRTGTAVQGVVAG